MAMGSEAKPVIKKLGLEPMAMKNWNKPIQFFSGNLAGTEIILATNGVDARYKTEMIGSQSATLTTNYVAEAWKSELIISAGTAGGVQSRGAQVGDVYLSLGPIRYHDRRYPMAGYHEYGVGNYPSMDASAFGFKLGRISSGDSLHMSTEEAGQFAANEADVKDMEAAAVAWVSSLHGIPFMAVKVITDLIDHPLKVEKQFVKNFEQATEKLSEGLLELITQRLPKATL